VKELDTKGQTALRFSQPEFTPKTTVRPCASDNRVSGKRSLREKISVIADDELARVQRKKAREEEQTALKHALQPKDNDLKDLEIEGKRNELEHLTKIRGLELEMGIERMTHMKRMNELEIGLKQGEVELQRLNIERKALKLAALKRKVIPE